MSDSQGGFDRLVNPDTAHATPAQSTGPGAAPLGSAVVAPRRMATWKIVALTLGGVFLAGVLFVGGLVTGIAMSDVAGSASSGSLPGGGPNGSGSGGDGSGDAGGSGGATGSDPINDCLVGTWKTQSYEQRAKGDQGENVLTGLARTFTFDKSGKHVVRYDSSVATMKTPAGSSELTFDGTVNYQVSVNGSTMSFELESVEGSVTVKANGSEKKEDLKPGTGDVSFTCEGDTYTETAEGYKEVSTRVK